MDPASAILWAITMFGEFPCGNIATLRKELETRGVPLEHRLDRDENGVGYAGNVAWVTETPGVYILYMVKRMDDEFNGCESRISTIRSNTENENQ